MILEHHQTLSNIRETRVQTGSACSPMDANVHRNPILGCPWVGLYPCDCPEGFSNFFAGGCPVSWLASNPLHHVLPVRPRALRRTYCEVVISLARVALCTRAHKPLFSHLRSDSNAMECVYVWTSLLAESYMQRQGNTGEHEWKYQVAFTCLSLAAVVGPLVLRPRPHCSHEVSGLQALQLDSLHYQTNVHATFNALLPLFRDVTVIVMNFWQGGIRRADFRAEPHHQCNLCNLMEIQVSTADSQRVSTPILL